MIRAVTLFSKDHIDIHVFDDTTEKPTSLVKIEVWEFKHTDKIEVDVKRYDERVETIDKFEEDTSEEEGEGE